MKSTVLLSFTSLTAAAAAAEAQPVHWAGVPAAIPINGIEAYEAGITLTAAADVGLTAEWEATRTGSDVRVDLRLTNELPQEQRLAVGSISAVDAQTGVPVVVLRALEDTRTRYCRMGFRLDHAHLAQGVPHRVTWRLRPAQGAAWWRIRVPLHTASGYRLIGTELRVPEDTAGLGPLGRHPDFEIPAATQGRDRSGEANLVEPAHRLLAPVPADARDAYDPWLQELIVGAPLHVTGR